MINIVLSYFINILLLIVIISNVNAEYNICNDDNGNEGLCLDTKIYEYKTENSINGQCPNDSENVKCVKFLKSNSPFVKGIDIADYQKDIQWDKVKNTDVEFVIMRASLAYSETTECYVDEKFEEYYQGATNIDIKKGAYFYTHATSQERMKMDVEYFLQAVKDKTFQYPFFIDVETEGQKNMGKKEFTDMIIYGAELIKQNTNNHPVGVYTTLEYYKNYLEESRIREKGIKQWFAQYGNYDFDPSKHDLSNFGEYWQYTNLSRIDGISTEVDSNVHYINQCSCSDENDTSCSCNSDNTNTSNVSTIIPTINSTILLIIAILIVNYLN